MKWYILAFKNFSNFTGRAGRAEYWFFALFNAFFAVIALILDIFFKTSFTKYDQGLFVGWIYLCYSIVVFVPALSLTCRRLQDTNKNALYFLIPVLSFGAFYVCLREALKNTFWRDDWSFAALAFLSLGLFIFALILAQKGSDGKNKYGDRLTKTSKPEATESLLLILIIVQFCTWVSGACWSMGAKKLSAWLKGTSIPICRFRIRSWSFKTFSLFWCYLQLWASLTFFNEERYA